MATSDEVRLRRFSKVSSDCVFQAAQNLGIQVSNEVSSALVDDVSFRVRHITDTACQFMQHAKRTRLTTDDFDKALKWSRVEPVHGHQTGQSSTFSPTQNSSVFIVYDSQVELTTAALTTQPLTAATLLPNTPHVEASWVAIEGTAVAKTNPQEQGQAPPTVELQNNIDEFGEKYLTLLMESVTGDKEDLRLTALAHLQKSPAIANILPDIAAYLQEAFCDWLRFTPGQLCRLLKLCLALFQNPSLYFEPYLPSFYPVLKAILLDSSYLMCVDGWDHWTVRELAAVSLATLLHRCSLLNESLVDLCSSLRVLLSSAHPPLPALYGSVLTLCYMPGDSLVTLLYPSLEELVSYLNTGLNGKLGTTKSEELLRVQESLLFGAELLLTGDYQLEEEQAPPTPPPPAHTGRVQPSPPKESEGLFASTAFGLSSETTDMEIEHSNAPTELEQSAAKKEKKTPSMYNALIELFGESLLFRLSSHPQFMVPSQIFDPTKQPLPDLGHKMSTHTSPALLSFLSQEGFKSLKVELPLARLAHSQQRTRWTLAVPKTHLPVGRNILEQKSREAKHQKRERRRRIPRTDLVKKGPSASYRKHNIKNGFECVGVLTSWL